jgi:hypothetical protein
MALIVVLLTLLCYGGAVYLLWQQQTPIYLFALLSGHAGALAVPLWALLYQVSYRADLGVLFTVAGEPLYAISFIAGAWFYPLPALLVLYLYRLRWWFPGYLIGLVSFGAMLFYHTMLESIGLGMSLWGYTNRVALPFGISTALISTLMNAFISLTLLYMLLLIRRFSWITMFLVLLPATLLLSLLVHGLLGAPLWLPLLLTGQPWAAAVGMISTLALLATAVHIVALGLARAEWEMS